MATYRTRLPVDANVVGYYGFDEANETDVAVDESGNGRDLTVTAAVSVVAARLGNGRQFDGAATKATPADSVAFRVNALTVIVWATLDSVLQVGSQRRTIVSCDGPSAVLAEGGSFFWLGVDNNGAIIHEYHDAAGRLIRWKTANGAFLTGRYYSVALVRAINGAQATVTLYLNNGVTAWTEITADGVPISAPYPAPFVPNPATNQQTFKVGISDKYADAFWHGVIDELSVHKVARSAQPYLQAAYFRLTLSTTFQRLTAHGNVRTLGGIEMGGGTRWWCYERDQSIYVIRENSLGLFSAEILLTTGGLQANGAPMPGGVTQPRLAYDASTDTLLVVFIGAGRVYKVTARSGDAASTQNMPNTQDTALILKCNDQRDIFRSSSGQPGTQQQVGVGLVRDSLAAPTIAFLHTPSFGIAVEGNNANGYLLYRITGGVETLVATLLPGTKQTTRYEATQNGVGNYWFVPVASRAYGDTYVAHPRLSSGSAGAAWSNVITDYLGLIHTQDGNPNALILSRHGDWLHEHFSPGPAGQRVPLALGDVTLVTWTPVKIGETDPVSIFADGQPPSGFSQGFVLITRTPVKVSAVDPWTTFAAGQPNRVTMGSTNRYGV